MFLCIVMQGRLIALMALFFFLGGGSNGPILYPFLYILHLPRAFVVPLPEEAQSCFPLLTFGLTLGLALVTGMTANVM